MKRLYLLIAAILAVGTVASAQTRPAVRSITETDVMVPMRDGVRLATDIVRPAGEGRYPVVLVRTPYKKGAGGAAGFVNEGYVYVVQDVRGRFASEGEFYPFGREAEDGYDTVEWIAKQPWCDGNVGMQGGSYLGLTQLATAMTRPLALKCIMPAVPPSDLGQGTLFIGGAMRLEIAQGWLVGQSWASQRVLRKRVPAEELKEWEAEKDYRKWCWHLPMQDVGPITVGGPGYIQGWKDIIASWEKPEFWRPASAVYSPEKIQVPVLIVGGLYDIFTQENIDLLLALRHNGGSEATRQHSHLLIGPWTHGIGGPAGDVNFTAAKIDFGALTRIWMERWLKGRPNGVDSWPAMRAFIMGQDRWINTDTWPPQLSKPARLYLTGSTFSLKAPEGKEDPSTFTYDPQDPVPTLGGNNLMIPGGIHDHRANAQRKDVLAFTTPALGQDFTLMGPVRVHLNVSSSAPDTDITAMLLDIRPDGYMANVQDTVLRLRYRDGRDKPALLQDGQIVAIDLPLWSTAYTFKAGHKLALHISSSNFPRFDRNMNVADAPWAWTRGQKAENKVYHDSVRQSYIEMVVEGR